MKEIVNGHLKELLRQNEEMYEERIEICKKCPEYYVDKVLGARCKKCGCRLKAKCRIADAKCPLNK